MEFVFTGEDSDGREEVGGGFDSFFGGTSVITINIVNDNMDEIVDSIEHEVLHKIVSGMNLPPEVEERMICRAACDSFTFKSIEEIPDER